MFSSSITVSNESQYTKKFISKPIKIYLNKSESPHIPNSPPVNTPPNIEVIRELYLNYLSKIKLK